jgi:hypothetical protein
MRHAVWAALSSAVLVLLLLPARPATARPDYTRRTSKDCAYCHMPPGYNLNDAGKYYA